MDTPGKRLWLAAGALVGLLVGTGIAYWLWSEQQQRGRPWNFNLRKGMRLTWETMQAVRRWLAVLEGD